MASVEDAHYRLRLARGFLDEALQDRELYRWRSCVDSSQLAVENAARAVLTLVGPVARTHAPADLLMRAVAEQQFTAQVKPQAERLAELARGLGWEVHAASDYGDEAGRRTPRELFDDSYAERALGAAQEVVALAQRVVDGELQR